MPLGLYCQPVLILNSINKVPHEYRTFAYNQILSSPLYRRRHKSEDKLRCVYISEIVCLAYYAAFWRFCKDCIYRYIYIYIFCDESESRLIVYSLRGEFYRDCLCGCFWIIADGERWDELLKSIIFIEM